MLLDLWEWFLLISDGIDLVISNLASGTYPIPLSFLLVTFFFTFISLFAWRSTDIPDLPPAPRPPYVIQITAGPSGSGGSRQTISDVRLISGGAFFDRGEILSGYPNISRHQATNTDRPGTSSVTGILRNAAGGRQVDVNGQTLRRRSSGRSFILGLFRRPNFPRPVPVPAVNAIRAQLSSPNVVVYHRVNVYHHHIHSHVGSTTNSTSNNNSNSSNGGAATNQSPNNPSQVNSDINQSVSSATDSVISQEEGQSPSTSQSSTEQIGGETTNLAPEQNLIADVDTSRLDQAASTENSHVGGSGNVDGLIFSTSSSPQQTTTTTTVQIERTQDSLSVNEPGVNMPARSASNQSAEDGEVSSTNRQTFPQQRHQAGTSDGVDDVRFTIKFLNDTQMDVTSQLGEKIVDFKRRHFATEMSENKTVRLIFNGRVLDNDNKTLREFGIFDQCVVHCLIVNRQQNQDQSRNASGTGSTGTAGGSRNNNDAQGGGGNMRRVVGLPEPGMFFVAFIGIFLVFLWFICLHFGQHLFTQSAVVSLTVLTAIFLIGIVACYLPLPAN